MNAPLESAPSPSLALDGLASTATTSLSGSGMEKAFVFTFTSGELAVLKLIPFKRSTGVFRAR